MQRPKTTKFIRLNSNSKNTAKKATLDLDQAIARALILDPKNVSSFYAVNPDLLKMPAIALETQQQISSRVRRDLPGWNLNANWARICKEVISPFPINRTVIKRQLEKKYQVTFMEQPQPENKTPEIDDMYSRFKTEENLPKTSQIFNRDSLKRCSVQVRKLSLAVPRGDPMDDIVIDLTEIKHQQVKEELEAFSRNNQRRRRKSCHCQWCGGISNIEVKLDRKLMKQKGATREGNKDRSSPVPSSAVSSLRKIQKSQTQKGIKKKNTKNLGSKSRITPSVGVRSRLITKNSISSVGEFELNANNSSNIEVKTPERSPSPQNISRRSTFLLSPTNNMSPTTTNMHLLKKLFSVPMKDNGSEVTEKVSNDRKDEGIERSRRFNENRLKDDSRDDSYMKEGSIAALMVASTPKAALDFGKNEVSGFSNMFKIDVIPDEEAVSNEVSTDKNTENMILAKDDKSWRTRVIFSGTGSPKSGFNVLVEGFPVVKELLKTKKDENKPQEAAKQANKKKTEEKEQ